VRDLIANLGVTEDDPDAAATEPEHSAPRAKNCAAQPHHHARRLWNVRPPDLDDYALTPVFEEAPLDAVTI
jgi:hypothetical protein